MRPSRCKRVWADGGVARVLMLHLVDPRVAEIAAAAGWDCLWIDLEHSPKTTRELDLMCLAARAGSAGAGTGPDVMARPGKGEYMRMGRLLEAGAHGILYPRCESAEEAREAVRWAKFAPLGERGFDGGNADNAYGAYPGGDYTARANEETWLALQVETPAGVEHARAIAEVEGVDALFFGPGDYSCLIGKPGAMADPAVLDACGRAAEAARRAGKVFATLAIDEEHQRRVLDMGCRMICGGADQMLLKQGMRRMLDGLAGIVEGCGRERPTSR